MMPEFVGDDLPDDCAMLLNRIELIQYLTNDGVRLVADQYWTADGEIMALTTKLGMLEQAKIAACIPMIQSYPSPDDE